MKINKIKFSILFISSLLSIFFVSNCALALGPSFDCNDAKTNIEKWICSDPNLSAADQRLSNYYSELLEGLDKTEKDDLRKAQKDWLKEINQVCNKDNKKEGITCLNLFYKKRLNQLESQLKALRTRRAEKDTTVKKYPPYPDVWLRRIPDDRIERASLRFFQHKNGDIFITYENGKKHTSRGVITMHGVFTFFDNFYSKKVDMYSYFEKYSYKYEILKTPTEIILKDGTKISSKAIDIRASKPCPITLDLYLSIQTPGGKIIDKMPVYIRKKPQRRPIDKRCVDELNRSYIDKVISLAGRFVKLEDDTFLIYNSIEPTIILRLNKDKLMKFETYDENRIFWIDPALAKTTDNYQKLQDKIVDMKPTK